MRTIRTPLAHECWVLDHQSWGLGFKSRLGQKFGLRFLFHLHPLVNSAMMSTLTAHCQWEDETVRERTGHPPSYAEAKKMKSLTLHTHGCPRASLRDWSSSSSLYWLKLSEVARSHVVSYICAESSSVATKEVDKIISVTDPLLQVTTKLSADCSSQNSKSCANEGQMTKFKFSDWPNGVKWVKYKKIFKSIEN